jgi:DNA-binding HxlR family transcriptional regulator
MVMVRGFIEILQMAGSDGPKSFNDFTRISIKKKRLSPATISKRLDQLIALNTMEEVISRSKTGRRVIAYRATEKGRKVVELAKELEAALDVSNAK